MWRKKNIFLLTEKISRIPKKKKSINIEPCQFDFNFYLVRDFGLENILPHKSQRAAFNIL